MFPFVSMRRKRSRASAGWDGKPLSSAFTQSSVLSPQSSVLRNGRRRRAENVCGAHFEAQPYDGGKPKIPMMFPGCIHDKEKD
jgi:hypothetical protein